MIPTAQEARNMHPDRAVNEWLEKIGKSISEQAQAGRTSVRIPYDLTEVRGEGSVAPKGNVGHLVAAKLVESGYRIIDHWDCGQFVDAYLSIEWGEA